MNCRRGFQVSANVEPGTVLPRNGVERTASAAVRDAGFTHRRPRTRKFPATPAPRWHRVTAGGKLGVSRLGGAIRATAPSVLRKADILDANLVLLPGDGIGPEVMAEGEKVLRAVATRFQHRFEFERCPMGGNAIDSHGTPLPDETLAACKASQAVLLAAVGGPKWDDPAAKTRPEAGLLKLRKELGLFANLRPIKPHPVLLDASPLKREIVEGVDILFVRELTGDVYFGESGRKPHPSGEEAWNVMIYSTGEVERVVRLAAQAARKRRGKSHFSR